jgi:cytochrome b involved in lipid metabolism
MIKKILITIVVLAVLVGGGFAYINYESEKELENFATESSQVATTTEIKTYTLTDISVHKSKNDCWLAINGDVLDVTSFISKHPGGDRILEGCGIDATVLFKSVPGHNSSIAKLLVKKLTIGKLAN